MKMQIMKPLVATFDPACRLASIHLSHSRYKRWQVEKTIINAHKNVSDPFSALISFAFPLMAKVFR